MCVCLQVHVLYFVYVCVCEMGTSCKVQGGGRGVGVHNAARQLDQPRLSCQDRFL
ncbi:hypothetical protein BC940DRAFT_306140 [Gongronella butleri]|nr:hypothetical protein BC940DRAFT_306140 [Gongronella butleri]